MAVFSLRRSTFGGRKLRVERLEDRRVLTADFNGNGTVDAPDLDIWKTGFGTVGTATQPIGDANGDTNVDGSDFLIWQRTFGESTLPPRAPDVVNARAVGATSIEVTWSVSLTATTYAVARRDPSTETAFSIIASNVAGTNFTDTGLATNTLYQYVVIARRNPDSVPSKLAEAVTTQSNLTAYRPQWVKDFEKPEEGAFYDRYGRWSVLDEQEISVTEGPGIRINADDDDGNGISDRGDTSAVPQENDLIEVKIDRVPGSGAHSLFIGGQLQVFYHADRTQQILSGDPIGFVDDTATVFVEWVSSSHGTALLTLNQGVTPMDTVRFHSFRSIVVVFGGNSQNAYDSDGDGSMGDPVEGLLSPEGNREGMFDYAQNLYLTGWDVYAFNEEELRDDNVEGSIAYQEVTNALDRRFVGTAFDGGFSLIGYSQGGGAVWVLADAIYRRNETPDNVTTFAVYVDAVDHNLADPDGPAPETREPLAAFTLNLYQRTILPPNGNAIDEPHLGIVEQYNVNDTPGFEDVGHQQIDDEFTFHALITDRLLGILGNR